jgi:hypothetical protein
MSPKPSSRPSLEEHDRVELGHVVVAGGTPHEWAVFGAAEWGHQMAVLAAGVARAGTRWLTLYPFGGDRLSPSEVRQMDDALSTSGKIKNVGDGEYPRWIFEADDGLSICVEPEPDGRRRFARVLNMLRTQHDEVPIDDTAVANAVSAPSPREPDLVVILGPPTHLPTSLVWELAYSELVFLDLGWTNLTAADLELAVDDFTRRNRRFGGLDS